MDNIKDTVGYITERIQKLTAALYRVTDLMSDKEPLKWTLRDKALSMHDCVMSIKTIKDKDRALNDALDYSFHVIKSLELVAGGACISNLNFEILKREYIYAKNFLEGKKNQLVYDQKIVPEIMFGPAKKEKEPALLESDRININMVINEAAEIHTESRKGKILDFLKEGGAKTVGEIAAIFNGGASDKAVQRDLFDLVKLGKVSAKGEKRWRKYEISPVSGHSAAQNNPILTNYPI